MDIHLNVEDFKSENFLSTSILIYFFIFQILQLKIDKILNVTIFCLFKLHDFMFFSSLGSQDNGCCCYKIQYFGLSFHFKSSVGNLGTSHFWQTSENPH